MTVVDTSIMWTASASCAVNSSCRRWAPRSVARFPATGHGDALPTVLKVLEQEAEDPRHRRINRLRRETRLPSGKTWEAPVFTGAGSSSMTGCPWRSGSNRTD